MLAKCNVWKQTRFAQIFIAYETFHMLQILIVFYTLTKYTILFERDIFKTFSTFLRDFHISFNGFSL